MISTLHEVRPFQVISLVHLSSSSVNPACYVMYLTAVCKSMAHFRKKKKRTGTSAYLQLRLGLFAVERTRERTV